MALVFLGDIHLRDDKNYFRATCDEFLSWYKDWEYNNSSNILLLAGDLVENALLSGTVVDYLQKFAIYSKFKEVHICVGNHDIRKYNDENQLAYEFYKNFDNFHIYDESTKITVEGKRGLILPYFKGTNFYGITMSDLYSNLYKNKTYQEHFDFVLGHFNEDSMIFGGDVNPITNLDKLDADRIILGHIHTRNIRPDLYIGSVFAGKKGENDYKRSALILDEEGWHEERLPLFNEFITVTYPDKLPQSKSKVPIYTVLNCGSEQLAESKYGKIFLRKTTTELVDTTIRRKVSMDRTFDNIKNFDILAHYDSCVKEQNPPLDSTLVDELRTMLKNRQAS